MKKIAYFNQKGGTGKTSTVVNTAGTLCKIYGKKILVVDCDSQMNATKYLLTELKEPIEYTLVDYFSKNIEFEKIVKTVRIKFKANQEAEKINIDVIPITNEIDKINISDITLLKTFIDKQEKNYDFCFFDCPPYISPTALNAICASDFVIVPARADDDSLGGYGLLVDTVNDIRRSGHNVGVEILGILMNNVAIHEAFERFMMEICRDGLNDVLFTNYIRRASDIEKARHFGKPISYYKQSSPVAKDYEAFAKELLYKMKFKKRR